MKKLFYPLLFIFSFSFCEGQSWSWARQGTGIGIDDDPTQQGYSVATDSIGNVFETGCFNDTVIFGMDSLFENISEIANDIYLVKYDSSGNVLWAKSSFQDKITQPFVLSVKADNKGNSYITGYYSSDTISFGYDTLYKGYNDFNAFYVKYNPLGIVLWAKTAIPGTTNSNISGHVGCPDNMGNSYLTGTLDDTVTFGVNTLYSSSNPTLFLIKYDINGNVLWAKNAILTTSSSSAYPYSVSTDKMGNAYVTGYFNDTVSFGSYSIYSGNNYSIFLAKYDTNGTVLWATGAILASGASNIYGMAISTDYNGNSFVTGYYEDTIYFGAQSISTLYTSVDNAFLAKYDSNGNFKWVRTPTLKNSQSEATGLAVSTDNFGNVYISGHLLDTVSFGTDTLIENHSYRGAFIAKYDSSGNVLCAEGLANGGDHQNGVSTDRFGNAYFGSDFASSLPFILGEDTLSSNYESAVLAKWLPCVDTNIITSVTPFSNKFFISLYPNPNNGIFTIQSSVVSRQLSVEIYNVMGQNVLTETLRYTQGDNIINLSNQPNGVYFYRVLGENRSLIGEGKVIIQK
jgi:Secretion system C-terminal sorting domain